MRSRNACSASPDGRDLVSQQTTQITNVVQLFLNLRQPRLTACAGSPNLYILSRIFYWDLYLVYFNVEWCSIGSGSVEIRIISVDILCVLYLYNYLLAF